MFVQLATFVSLLSLVSATPLEKRQTGSTSNELIPGACRSITFIFARGSTEPGNMGTICGPPTSDILKSNFGANNVATQGVDYAAALATNFLPGNADPAGISDMQSKINEALTDCPQSILVVGGYSQGAAVLHGALGGLPSSTTAKIAGAVTFGDTRNAQDGGRIPNFDPAKTLIICAPGDLVCNNTLTITPAHLSYGAFAPEAAAFLTQEINKA